MAMANVLAELSQISPQSLARDLLNQRINEFCRRFTPSPFEDSPEPVPTHGYWQADLDFISPGAIYLVHSNGRNEVRPPSLVSGNLPHRRLTEPERTSFVSLIWDAYNSSRNGNPAALIKQAGALIESLEV